MRIAGDERVRSKTALAPVLIVSCVYLALALAWSWPLPLHVMDRFTHDPGDPLLNVYLIWWNAHAFPLTAAYWNAPYYAPMRDALALTEHFAGLSPITTPLQWAGLSPLATANLILIASTWWTALATHALMRRLGGSTAAAYCAGIAFAYAPYRTSQVGHLQLYACWWLPLILLALHAYYSERRVRWLVLLGVSWALQGLTNGYFLLFTPALIACWLLWFTRRAELAAAVRVAAAMAIASLPVLPFLLKYREVQTANGLARTPGEMVIFSARLSSFASAHPIMRFWHTAPPITTEQYLFPGVTAAITVAAGAYFARRDGRFVFYVLAALLMTLLCTGPAPAHSIAALWRPYTWLTWLPGYGGLRVPSRFFMLTALCLSIAAGLSFDAIQRRLAATRTRPATACRAFAIVVFSGLAFDGAIAGMPLGAPPPRLTLHEPGARVLVLPFEDGRASVAAMYQSIFHRLPVVNGYSGYIPPHADVIEWALHRADATVLTELRRGHPLYVMVASGDGQQTWTAFMNDQTEAQLLGVQGGGALYRMPPAPYAHAPRAGTPIDAAISSDEGWLIADLRRVQPVRGLELRTYGVLHPMPDQLIVETSIDGRSWTTVFDDRPGGALLIGALASPRIVPLRIDLQDTPARYVRLDTPAFSDCVFYR